MSSRQAREAQQNSHLRDSLGEDSPIDDPLCAAPRPGESQPVSQSPQAAWKKILTRFNAQQDGISGRNWLRTVTPLNISSEETLLGITSAFSRDLLVRNCGPLLSQVVREMSCGPISWRVIEDDFAQGKLNPVEGELANQRSGLRENNSGLDPARFTAPERGKIPEGLRQNLTLDRFVVGRSNQVAYSAVREVLRKPGSAFNPVFLHGGSGLGKTHLLQAITREFFIHGERSIRYVQCEQFVHLFVRALQNKSIDKFRSEFRNLKVLAIDDVQMIAGKKSSQEELLETIDSIAQAGGQVLLACDLPPRKCQFLHQQLQNRFSAGLVVRMDPPDLQTRLEILERESIRSGLMVPPEVLHFIADRIRTSVRELLGALLRLFAEVDLGGKTIDLSLARHCLEPVIRDGQRVVTIDMIVEAVARRWSIPPEEIYSRSRTRNTSMARNVATFLARNLTSRSLAEIGTELGQRTHASASNSARKIRELLQSDADLRSEIDRLVRELSG